MSNLEKYNDIFMKVFEVSENDLGDEFQFDTVEKWDSVTHMMLISEIEECFDIMFDTDDILDLKSYSDGKIMLRKYEIEL